MFQYRIPISGKHTSGILIGIVLNLWIALYRMNMLALLNLPIHFQVFHFFTLVNVCSQFPF